MHVPCSVWPFAGERGCDVTDGDGRGRNHQWCRWTANETTMDEGLACASRPVCNLNLSSQPGFLTSLVALLFRCLWRTARKTAMQTITAGAHSRTGAREHKCATMHTTVVSRSSVCLLCAKFKNLSAKKVCFGGALLVLEDLSRALARFLGSKERCPLTFGERTLLTPARSNRSHSKPLDRKH